MQTEQPLSSPVATGNIAPGGDILNESAHHPPYHVVRITRFDMSTTEVLFGMVVQGSNVCNVNEGFPNVQCETSNFGAGAKQIVIQLRELRIIF